jgi:hypothetical protein
MEKRRIVLDVDGVVLNFNILLEKILKQNKIIYDMSQWESILPENNLMESQIFDLIRQCWDSPEFARLQPYPNTVETIKELVSEGYEIVYSTSVGTWNGIISRIKNLNSLGILDDIKAYRKFESSAYDKAETIALSGAKWFIDDKPKNIWVVKDRCPNVNVVWMNHGARHVWQGEFDKTFDYEALKWEDVKKLLLHNQK